MTTSRIGATPAGGRQTETARRQRFTLIEVLVAVTVLAVLMPAVLMTFSAGLTAYRRCRDYGDLLQDARGALRLLEHDLQRAVPVGLAGNTYSATTFAFVVQSQVEKRQSEITYSFAGGVLTREVRPLSEGSESFSTAQLLTGVQSLVFEYQVNKEWVQSAPKGSCPSFVRLQYGTVNGVASESCIYEVSMPRQVLAMHKAGS